MEFRHAKRLILAESKKRVFTGQSSEDMRSKFFSSMFVFIFGMMTMFVGPILLAIFKKKRFHPNVFSTGSTQEVEPREVTTLLAESDYKLAADEKAEILIKTAKNNFLLFTDKNVFYELRATAKLMDLKTVSGKLPLSQAKAIKFKNRTMVSEIMIGDELIGSLSEGSSDRINRLLKEIAKDVREDANVG